MVLCTLAMPADTNANCDIFGGWLMSQYGYWWRYFGERAGAGPGRVTVRVDGTTFLKPVAVGDVICCYAPMSKNGDQFVDHQYRGMGEKSVIGAHQPALPGYRGGVYLRRGG